MFSQRLSDIIGEHSHPRFLFPFLLVELIFHVVSNLEKNGTNNFRNKFSFKLLNDKKLTFPMLLRTYMESSKQD